MYVTIITPHVVIKPLSSTFGVYCCYSPMFNNLEPNSIWEADDFQTHCSFIHENKEQLSLKATQTYGKLCTKCHEWIAFSS